VALDRPDLVFAIVRALVEATHPANPCVLKQPGSNAGLKVEAASRKEFDGMARARGRLIATIGGKEAD